MQADTLELSPTVLKMKANETALITEISATDALRSALAAHGIVVGAEIRFIKSAPLGDPLQLRVSGGNVCVRKKDAELIFVKPLCEKGAAGA